jgi:lipopolysaccharide export system permease protein
MVIAGRIQRYIFRESLMGLLLVLGIIMLAIVLVDVVEQMRTVGSRTEIGIGTAFSLTLLDMPRLILETLPFAMLVGSILTYSRLSRRSEIPAIRAAGVSAWRFLGPAIVLALLTGVLMVTVLDPLATRSTLEFQDKRAALLDTRSITTPDPRDGVWLSQGDSDKDKPGAASAQEGQAIISAKRIVGRAEALEDATFYYFRQGAGGGDERDFAYRIDAKRAVLVPGFWQLEGVIENHPGGDVRREDKLALPTSLRPDALLSRFASSKTIPFWELPQFIRQTRSAGLEVDQYVLKLHTLLATPLMMVAMALIGAVFCLRLARSGGLSRLIGAGAVTGFLLFFANKMAANLSASGATSPEAAAWCPPLIALFAVLTLIAHAEDG